MKIKGSFKAKCGQNIISSGQNTITNDGKKIIRDWLLQKTYINNTNTIYEGKYLNTQRFLSQEQFVATSATTTLNNVKNFSDISSITTINNNDEIYYEIINGTINLAGLFFYLKNSTNGYQYRFRTRIYTSKYEKRYADENDKWDLQKIVASNSKNDLDINMQKMIKFDSAYSVDGYLSQIKSIKMCFDNLYNSSTYYANLYGIGVLQKLPISNIPCVIGLGTRADIPTINDVELYAQTCKLFVNTQKSYLSYSDATSDLFIDINNIPSGAININTQSINIVYSTRLNYEEYNNIQFKQIGLFYSNNQVNCDGENNCDKMFSRGLFDTTWTKTNDKIIDVEYTISIAI